MFLAPSPSLQADETLIKSGAATRHGYGKSCVFALTNKRIIFKTLSSEDWFPLSRLKSVSRTGIFLNIQFDNGRSMTVSTFDAEKFQMLIERAKVNAPEMDYQPVSEQQPSFLSPRTCVIFLIVGAVIGLCMLFVLAAVVGLYFFI